MCAGTLTAAMRTSRTRHLMHTPSLSLCSPMHTVPCLCPLCRLQSRVLQLETQLRQRDGEVEKALQSASGGRDKQVGVLAGSRFTIMVVCSVKGMMHQLLQVQQCRGPTAATALEPERHRHLVLFLSASCMCVLRSACCCSMLLQPRLPCPARTRIWPSS